MPPHLKPPTLFLLSILTFCLTGGVTHAQVGCSAADFSAARSFDIGANFGFPRVSLATADFNTDGKPDLAATDNLGNAVAIFLNDGTGWFAAPATFDVGTRPSAVVVADFNNDGRPDLAVTNEGSNNVSVLLGSGGGVFGSAANFAVGDGPNSITAGDFNGDGKIDLAVGNTQGRSVSMLIGNGAGAFSAPGLPFSLSGQVLIVDGADFNSDGKRDLVVGTSGVSLDEDGFFVMLGDGLGSFSSLIRMFSAPGLAASAKDLNGDGKADLVLGHFGGMAVLIGDGTANFSLPKLFTLEIAGSANAVAVADFDSDGKLDVAAAGGGITIFKGDGTGDFTRGRTFLARSSPSSLALGDFDSDTKQDIAASGGGGLFSSFSIILNTGAGTFAAPRVFATESGTTFGSFATDLALADFNNDGRQDMAVSNRGQAGVQATVAILLDDGAGGFTRVSPPPIIYFPGTFLNQVVTADFNEDGKADVAVAGTISIPFMHVVSISLGNGNGTFAAPLNISVGDDPIDLAVAEFNNDGNLDIVVVSGSSQNFSILFGNGMGGVTFAAAHSVGTRFDRVAVGDFNGDTKQDLVITDFDDHRLVVLQNNDGGQFGVIQSVDLPGRPTAVVVDDFNADGKRDIAVASQLLGGSPILEEGRLSVLLGDGVGGFAAPVHHEISSMPTDLLSRDFDGDGKRDLALSDSTLSLISVLSGDGAGGFGAAVNFEFAGGPIEAHDFNSDTRPDLAILAPFGQGVDILFGKTPLSQPCLFADNATVTEGDSGSINAEVPIRLSAASSQVVKVNYLLHGAFAIEGQDFEAGRGTVTFQPGETSKVVAVPVLGDISDEPEESFSLHLSGPLNGRISDGIAKINIQDNDPTPSIMINDASVTEGNSIFSPNSVTFTVTLSAPSAFNVSVAFAVASGTATVSNDFEPTSGTVFFGAGTTSMTINVSTRPDLTHEPDETFFVNLSNPVNATIADSQGQGTILNDDPTPSATIFDSSGFEVTGVDSTLTLTVRLSNPSSLPVSMDFATSDGTATAGSDYNSSTGSVSFNPGETEKTFTLTVKDDTIDEVTENFFVTLSNPVNVTFADNQASCAIFDNDGPSISVNDVTVVEGQSGRMNATFTLTLSAPSPQNIFVRASTSNGTASGTIFPSDFIAFTNRFVFIPAGATSATVTVLVNADLAIEPDETFFLNLSQPQDATIADSQGMGTITNDDTTSVRLNTDALTVNEADGRVQLTVTRIGVLSGVFTAEYTTFDSFASERSDYTTSLGTLRFEANEPSKTITVFITNDALVEDPETFIVFLTGPNGIPVNQPSTAIITINSDDAAPGPNPIDDATFFVRQHYRDFLNRDPDAAGLAFWVNEITSCGGDPQCVEIKRINVSAAFFLSIESQETGYLAYRMYKAAYGDATSPNVPGTVPIIRLREFLLDAQRMGEGFRVGIGDWEQQLETNKRAYALEFVQRARFLAAYPTSMTADEFVTKLEQNVGGALSPTEKAALIALLGSTPSDPEKRAQVLRAVADDADLRQAEFNRAFVLMQYYGYLRRNPDDQPDTNFGGWKFWLDKLNQFNGNFVQAEMVKAFISSIEYRQRFGP